MGRSGVITKEYKGKENTSYHDINALFKIYRAVSWNMQIKISQVKQRFCLEYGTDVDAFLDSIYQAGMDINQELADLKPRVEIINRSNQFLKLMEGAVDLMRKYHPQEERYYGYFITVICQHIRLKISKKFWMNWNHISRNSQGSTEQPIFGGGSRRLRRSAVFCGDMRKKAGSCFSISGKLIRKIRRGRLRFKNEILETGLILQYRRK